METVGDNPGTVKSFSPVQVEPGTIAVRCGGTGGQGGHSLQGVAAVSSKSPSLSLSHNCITEEKHKPSRSSKMPYVVRLEVERLAREYGLERLGFLTFTFEDRLGLCFSSVMQL